METKWMWGLVLLSALAGVFALAGETGASDQRAVLQGGSCHTLMTDLECAAFQVVLSATLPGGSRERLLAQYQATVNERESACSCARAVQAEVAYPRVQQVALHL